MKELIVDNLTIRQDSEGRYNLADLHKAAGGIHKQKSHFWLLLDKTEELIKSLKSGNLDFKPVEVRAGRYGGTYVCKELVYDYAMWISPEFKLKVIRAFDTLQTEGVAFSDSTVEKVSTGELSEEELVMKAVDILQKRVNRLREERDQIKHERDGVVNTIGKYDHALNHVVRMFDGVNVTAIKRDLFKHGYLYRSHSGTYRVYRRYSELFIEKFNELTGQASILVTAKGKALLGRLYSEGKLTMKVGHKVV